MFNLCKNRKQGKSVHKAANGGLTVPLTVMDTERDREGKRQTEAEQEKGRKRHR